MMPLFTHSLFGMQKYASVRHPYPALSSFADTDLDRSLFFGRQHEADDLLGRVLTSDLVLLFGRSGFGKTSLINAGLMQPLRKQRYFPVVCQLTHSYEQTPFELIRSRMLEAARNEGVHVQSPEGCRSLWEYFYRSTFEKEGQHLRPVLILDQFEELFSRIAVEPQWGPDWQRQLIGELSDLVRRRVPAGLKETYLAEIDELPEESEERRRLVDCLYGSGGPDVKVLIAMREDFLAELEQLRPQIPAIFSNAVRLEPLTAQCARLAITQPAERANLVGMDSFTFEDRALDEIIEFLSLDKRTGKPQAGACIEPAQLQILCYDLSVRRLRSGAKTITAGDLRGVHGMRRIIRIFYYRILRRFPRVRLGWSARKWWPALTNFWIFHRPRKSISRLCEYGLLTATGYRNSLILDSIQRRFGVSKQDLDQLVNLRLLRAEPRLGTVFYELVHDTLVEPLRVIRRNRRFARVVTLVGLVFLPWAAFGVYNAVDRWYAAYTFESASASPDDRAEAFSKLTSKGRTNFANADLAGMELTSVTMRSGTLAGADLNGTTLRGVYFNNVDFRGADMRNAQFEGASFSNSDLVQVQVEGSKGKPRAYGTAWWMAVGWSDDQIAYLRRSYAPASYMGSTTYRKRVQELLKDVENANGPERAIRRNELAWYRATNGTELLVAYKEVTEALKSDVGDKRAYLLDTRGFIRLQLGEYTSAVEDLAEAARLVRAMGKDGRPDPQDGLIHYHLGLAYEASRNAARAKEAFALAKKHGYEPSYERVLTPRLAAPVTKKQTKPRDAKEYLRLLNN